MKRYSIFVFVNVYLNIAFVSVLILMGYGILGAVVALLITRVIIFLGDVYPYNLRYWLQEA